MKTRWVAVFTLLVAALAVTACAPGLGRLGQGGMMGHYSGVPLALSHGFLDVAHRGTEADDIVVYYGYHTIMTTFGDKHYGMSSVDGFSGDVWYHTWHGMFLSEVEE